jgi:hypothetical protein
MLCRWRACNDVLEGHVALEVECVDRLYLNAYLPNLQVGGQVVRFLCGHLGKAIASAALLSPIGNRFRAEVKRFAAERTPVADLDARVDLGFGAHRQHRHQDGTRDESETEQSARIRRRALCVRPPLR